MPGLAPSRALTNHTRPCAAGAMCDTKDACVTMPPTYRPHCCPQTNAPCTPACPRKRPCPRTALTCALAPRRCPSLCTPRGAPTARQPGKQRSVPSPYPIVLPFFLPGSANFSPPLRAPPCRMALPACTNCSRFRVDACPCTPPPCALTSPVPCPHEFRRRPSRVLPSFLSAEEIHPARSACVARVISSIGRRRPAVSHPPPVHLFFELPVAHGSTLTSCCKPVHVTRGRKSDAGRQGGAETCMQSRG